MPPRMVIVRQVNGKRATFATEITTSPKGYRYFLFGTDTAAKALAITERKALEVLDEWRNESLTNANRCAIEPAPKPKD